MTATVSAWHQAFLFAVLLGKSTAISSPIVTPAVVYSCPGERVTFTCVVQNGHYLYWNVNFSYAAFSNIDRQRFITSHPLGSHRSISYTTGHTFDFELTSNSLGSLISTASTNAEQRLEGTRVSCQDASSAQNTSVIHIIQGPIIIESVQIIDAIPSGNQTVIVHVNVSTNNVRKDHSYFVTVIPSVESGPTGFITENSTFYLSVLYNREYTVNVVANNCAGNSTLATTTFNIMKCTAPMYTANITIEGYDVNSVAIEGSQITYYCKDGLVPRDRRVATCTNSSNWNPDPAELICKGTDQNSSVKNPIDCGSPTLLKGARILTDSYSTTEAAQVTLICTEGLFSNYTITSICAREGTWHPDPAKFSCLPETSDPHLNHSDSNSTTKYQPLSGYVIIALCTSLTVFCICILGVFSTISIQWCQRRRKRRGKVAETSCGQHIMPQGASPQQLSEPVYAECSLPTSSQEFNTHSNAAYKHPQVNMQVNKLTLERNTSLMKAVHPDC